MLTEPTTAIELIRFIPAAPAAVALLHAAMIGLFRRSLSRWVASIATLASLAVAFVLSVLAFFDLIGREGAAAIVDRVGPWIGAGVGPHALVVEWSFRFDALAAVGCLLVTGVGALAIVHAAGVMRDDERDDRGEQRFMAIAGFAIAAMLLLVLAGNPVLMVAGWTLVGVASWWLLGFWYGDEAHARAAMIAFVIGRVGDAALLGAVALAFQAMGDAGGIPLDFDGWRAALPGLADATTAWPTWLGGGSVPLAEVIAGLVLVAIVTRAAQLPVSGWLAETVSAPTPALVLVHTVLTVAAPIYVGVRLGFVFEAAPTACLAAGWIGGATAFVAAVVACAQTDAYRLLAWSTASQLGYALVALAAAAPGAAMYQLVAHAFHKGVLFMALGVAVASVGGERDIWRMGNLGSRLWRTRIDGWVAILSIGGLLPLTTGFFALEQVVVAVGAAAPAPGGGALVWLVLGAASATAFGMVRLMYVTFYGDTRIPPGIRWEDIEDPGPFVLWPMGLLAALSVGGALIGMPQIWADLLFTDVENANSLRHFLSPDFVPASDPAERATEWLWAGRAVSMAFLGALPAVWLYLYRPTWLAALAARAAPLHRALQGGLGLGRALARLGTPVVWVAERVLARRVEEGVVDSVAMRGAVGLVQRFANAWVRRLQSGSLLQYGATTALAVLGVLLYLVHAGRG